MNCKICQQPTVTSKYDINVRKNDEDHQFFSIPGSLCLKCHQLFLTTDLVAILGIQDSRITFAIETDRMSYPR